jgi:hypothetical protein
MKKVLLIVAVMLLSISTGSFAQVKFGVKAGLNIANLGGDDADDLDSRLVPLFGAFANFGLSEKLTFQPELLYSMKGAKNSVSFMGVDIETTMKLNYIDVPLMFKYNVVSGLNFQAGPQLGVLLSAETEVEGGEDSGTTDIKDNMKGMDFGLNVGAGYDFGSLGVDLRYNIGLSNISDVDDTDLKNKGFQIAFSYAF